MSEFKIENDVPMKEKGDKYPFKQMAVGSSFFCPTGTLIETVRTSATHAGKKLGIKFSVRKTEGGFRVWRVK